MAAATAAATVKHAKEHEAIEAQMAKAVGGSNRVNTTTMQQAVATDLPPDLDDWELSEGGLPEGSILSGSKALMEKYPEDEANSKKTKKSNTGKRKKSSPKHKA